MKLTHHLSRSRSGRSGGRSSRSEPEAGITTAEYAVGTAAGAGFAGLLYTLLTGAFGDQLLERMFKHVMSLLGIG
ncbi:DUF4244 domain-containing protein [uncultured Nocardioides sp.]|uniref:DUF4244 domain-containing protein n=1 Tax=uncultured Nocardioides sp. TaxID=198441 RepID=UPI00260266FC|nr:DUF4244 domain-containing protein [uncultured Nocardioides sp.]